MSKITYRFPNGLLRYSNGDYLLEVWPEKKKYTQDPDNPWFCPSCLTTYGTYTDMGEIKKYGYCVSCRHYNEGKRDNVIARRVATIEMVEEVLASGTTFEELSIHEMNLIYLSYLTLKKRVGKNSSDNI